MFVLSYFTTPSESLHLALSPDGYRWSALSDNPMLYPTGPAATLRDPHLTAGPDGLFHLLFTGSWHKEFICHATSPDLLEWSEISKIPVMAAIADTRNAWAPESFLDPATNLYHIFWSSTIQKNAGDRVWTSTSNVWETMHNHRIYHTTTRDFRTFSPTALFFDPGYSVIDATLFFHNGTYYLPFKDERGTTATAPKAIRMTSTKSLTSPITWTEPTDFLTPRTTEGPTLFNTGREFLMLFDHFTTHRYGAISSPDLTHWTAVPADQLHFPPSPAHPRHASVMAIAPALYARLCKYL